MTGPTFTLHLGDCLDVLRGLPDNSIDAVVTDPPYGLGKEPDALAMLTDWITTGHHDVKGAGFMGKSWDAFVPQPRLWAEVYRVLKPGGHVVAFAGTRTQDLMALGLRIAGFEIRDLLAWVYGSGFPKSLDVSKAIDKAAGAERAKVRVDVGQVRNQKASGGGKDGAKGATRPYIEKAMEQGFHEVDSDEPASPAARAWQGWGTALKPALEPITLARKPLDGTVAQTVLRWGTGAVNVDGCRVGTESTIRTSNAGTNGEGWGMGMQAHINGSESGRWPANLLHDGSDEVVGLFPVTTSGSRAADQQRKGGFAGTVNAYGTAERGGTGEYQANEGSAARFFYCAKASKSDRDEGLAHLEKRRKAAAEFRPNHAAKAEQGEGGNPYGRWDAARNIHPTVKPTDLMRWLCRLITPPGGVILDPFMGSGSTGKAAQREGFDFVGIEMDPAYMEIARARIETALNPEPADDPAPAADNDNTPDDLFQWGNVAT
jgi:site-specific DNA-methyltransferase (adenine-specific)